MNDFHGKNSNIKVDVFINNSSGGAVASKITGYFILRKERFRFTSIAFGRIGGHNVSLELSNTSINKIRKMGINPDDLQLIIQRKLIEGDVTLPENLRLAP